MIKRREFVTATGMLAVAVGFPVPASAVLARRISPRAIPGTDETLPVIGLGNSQSFREEDTSTASALIDIFLENGGGFIDAGGDSRLLVGDLLREKDATGDVFVGNYLDPGNAEAMRAEASSVAARQGKTALDLVHTRNLSAYRKNHSIYRQMKEAGEVRYIGIARSGEDGFEAIGELIKDGLVDFIQINYSLLEPVAAERLLPLAVDHGIAVTINRPFINGAYFGHVRGKELPEWADEFDCDSWAQFSLKFIVAHPAVNCVLTETANPAHAVDNLGAGYGRLPDKKTQRRMLQLFR